MNNILHVEDLKNMIQMKEQVKVRQELLNAPEESRINGNQCNDRSLIYDYYESVRAVLNL
jgi:UDP-N-acetylglucosamine enolpyruvyl transferase